MSKKILVTGVAGSGKSTLEGIFREKGYITSDIDSSFAEWINKVSGEVEEYLQNDPDWLKSVSWRLKTEKLREYLQLNAGKSALVFGTANGIYESVGLFDSVFLLEYPNEDSIVNRLIERPKGFGRAEHERRSVLSYWQGYQETLKQLGATPINCTLPVSEVVSLIEAEVRG